MKVNFKLLKSISHMMSSIIIFYSLSGYLYKKYEHYIALAIDNISYSTIYTASYLPQLAGYTVICYSKFSNLKNGKFPSVQ